ncbi:hypothetical protein T05_4996 [Trichinella murrelli]|uniref:Uncharacterized protein n=1 Tax=Trichinella murrelli TaxID=144512 RepID=A0A0V0UIQ7_9BILA|nr:hypothetical protein T05_4996 [Trichinella murrelli]
MTNGHRAVILWQEYVDVILSKLSTPPLACFPFRRKLGCHCAWYLVPKHSCSFLGVLDEINYSDGISKFIFDPGVHRPPFDPKPLSTP